MLQIGSEERMSEWRRVDNRAFLKWVEDEGSTASSILLRRAEWAVAHAIQDLRASGLVAAEAFAVAAVVLQTGNESATSLLKDVAAMKEEERRKLKELPSLKQALSILETRATLLLNGDLVRVAEEAEKEGNRRFSQGHHSAALPIVQLAVFARVQSAGEDALPTLGARFLEARVLNFLGRGAEALPIAQEVARKREQHPDLGPIHPSTLASRLFVVPILSTLGRSDEALCIAQDVASKREQHPSLGPLHPSTLASRFLVAQLLDKVGRSVEALPIAQDVASKAEQHSGLGPRHPSTIAGRFLLAQILDKVGQSAEALPIAQDAARKGEQNPSLGPLHPSTFISWVLVARILDRVGRSSEALPIAQDIASKRERHPGFGPLHPSTRASHTFVTQLLSKAGHSTEAAVGNKQQSGNRHS
jgi:hypothetical protein